MSGDGCLISFSLVCIVALFLAYEHGGCVGDAKPTKPEPPPPAVSFGPGIEHRVVCFAGVRYLVLTTIRQIEPAIAITPLYAPYAGAGAVQVCTGQAERP